MADTRDSTPAPAPDVARIASGRRGLLGGAAALLAGAGAVALPHVALAAGSSGPDAELIRLCDRLVAMNAEEQVIFASREDAADHEPFKSRLHALTEEWRVIDARLCDVAEPVTRAGALAVAKAAVAQAPKQADGSIDAPQLAEWLAFTVAQYVAREGVA